MKKRSYLNVGSLRRAARRLGMRRTLDFPVSSQVPRIITHHPRGRPRKIDLLSMNFLFLRSVFFPIMNVVFHDESKKMHLDGEVERNGAIIVALDILTTSVDQNTRTSHSRNIFLIGCSPRSQEESSGLSRDKIFFSPIFPKGCSDSID